MKENSRISPISQREVDGERTLFRVSEAVPELPGGNQVYRDVDCVKVNEISHRDNKGGTADNSPLYI